ncbi:hypothetical protein MATR_37470 [Marivirga tractuosa]|uniref:Phosphate-selective porin O and P n=1 Tax=Marivirga tractuosa (strain ATCC 23168 / DSM 4126 / NBRC 15989 / NCIMB 1408 / VKM B-1430 / H-43) TaxID=643867 RepID=E4TME8_MARTH|nr:hypothetical protein [Marivirga tractuosa]ADR22407.1 hypothetical protein Ftrac_2429 [Marivirga tractuosa DSM 4126]BDD16922.1 hypothetical protein MATR_37470 [Marivirga tractuosa]
MKTFLRFTMIALLMGFAQVLFAQDGRNLQFFRPVGQPGLNVFEPSKADTVEYEGVKVRVGGDFAMQFQGLSQSNDAAAGSGLELKELGNNFNLPTANLNLDVQMYDGVRLHLRTYLSARNHAEAWVKGGNLQIDKLDFIKEGFMEGIMKYTTVTIGLDEFNYGDAHFRRTDNARAIYNPFVGNYIMDAFSTEAFGEVTIQNNGLLAVVGVTNGKLNQSVTSGNDNKPSFYTKLGFDKQISDDFRARLTGSWYVNTGTSTGTWLYGGDRAGSRYYQVLHTVGNEDLGVASQGGNFDGRFNARFTKISAVQINPFIKAGGFEFFGIYEVASGLNEGDGAMTQIAGEALYRFGANERYYIGGRYNTVNGKMAETAPEDMNISRLNFGGGWFLTDNIMTKVEYVNQQYNGDAWAGRFAGAEFKGVMIEAAISF